MLTPLAAFYTAVERQGERAYLRQPVNGKYVEYTWNETARKARNIAYQLTQMGVNKGDKIALWSKNCAEWIIADLAIMMVGAVSVPLYPNQSKASVQYILNHSEAKALFIGKHDDDNHVINTVPDSMTTIGFQYFTGETTHDWSVMAAIQAPDSYTENAQALSDVMTIVYTSGTTGQPKGVVHTCRSFAAASNNMVETLNINMNERSLSFLPLANVAERMLVEGQSLYAWFIISFAESLESFNDNIKEVRPTMFFAVPRLWAKYQEAILEKIGGEKKLNLLLSLPIVGFFVKQKIRRSLGLSEARLLGCGASAVPKALLEWFNRLGMPILEGYGMSETFGYGTNVRSNARRLGSVGQALPQCTVKISDDGEVLLKSATMMEGYYKAPEKTAEVMFDGFYRTGDKGQLDARGFLTITGRLKELFKTTKGKFIAPARIEGLLMSHPFIEQVCVLGSGRDHPVAILELSESAKASSQLTVSEAIYEHLQTINAELENHEVIEQVLLTQMPWTVDNGLVTPTLKIRRDQIERHFLHVFDQVSGDEPVIWASKELEQAAIQAA